MSLVKIIIGLFVAKHLMSALSWGLLLIGLGGGLLIKLLTIAVRVLLIMFIIKQLLPKKNDSEGPSLRDSLM